MHLQRLSAVGLQLFASSGLETADFANMEELSNHMGLFLQVSHSHPTCMLAGITF